MNQCCDTETDLKHLSLTGLTFGFVLCSAMHAGDVHAQSMAADGCALPADTVAFDIDADSAVAYVNPSLISLLYSDVSPTGGDAPLLLRAGAIALTGWFDATAPYHATAVGNYSRIERRPEDEATTRNVNTAILYAMQQTMSSLLPHRQDVFRCLLTRAGLDPDDTSEDVATAVGIGNVAGKAAVRGRENDGMNQLGNEIGRVHNPTPYADYTGYRPVNTAYRLANASRWQPDMQRHGIGLYRIQQFVTPQYALVEPYSYETPLDYSVPRPFQSNSRRFAHYKAQADAVLRYSAELTEDQKLKAELFDDKLRSIARSTAEAARLLVLSPIEAVHLDFIQNIAAFDAGIFVWQEKLRFDAVRPFSAIRHIYGDSPVEAWAGPGLGRGTIRGSEWKAYLEEADHPEYPSASACFCAAHAQAGRRYLKSDFIDFHSPFSAGSSRIEPGVTPAADATVSYTTWTDFSLDCGLSRIWAGVHFEAAVEESRKVCGLFGDMAYDYGMSLISGTRPLREAGRGRNMHDELLPLPER